MTASYYKFRNMIASLKACWDWQMDENVNALPELCWIPGERRSNLIWIWGGVLFHLSLELKGGVLLLQIRGWQIGKRNLTRFGEGSEVQQQVTAVITADVSLLVLLPAVPK